MLRRRRLPVPEVTPEQRTILQQWTQRRTTAQALALRARIVLRLADGKSSATVGRELQGRSSDGKQVARAFSGPWRRWAAG